MSADRWSVCPKCKKIREKKLKELQKAVDEAYGKASKDEFLIAMKKFEDFRDAIDEDTTLREDYRFGEVDINKSIHISYKAACTQCGFHVRINQIVENTEDVDVVSSNKKIT